MIYVDTRVLIASRRLGFTLQGSHTEVEISFVLKGELPC